MTTQIQLGEITVEVEHKDIKNLHLSVYPPTGHVRIAAPLRMELELLYLNTSSIKAMMDIFDLLQSAHDSGREVAVNWYYDLANKRVGELAEEFTEDYTFAFEVIGR